MTLNGLVVVCKCIRTVAQFSYSNLTLALAAIRNNIPEGVIASSDMHIQSMKYGAHKTSGRCKFRLITTASANYCERELSMICFPPSFLQLHDTSHLHVICDIVVSCHVSI